MSVAQDDGAARLSRGNVERGRRDGWIHVYEAVAAGETTGYDHGH